MKYIYCFLMIFAFFSCKKKNNTDTFIDLKNTHWSLYTKYTTFSFYAKTNLHLKADNTFQNDGLVDTTFGTWQQTQNTVNITFQNNTKLIGNIIETDSITGTIQNAAQSGIWYAKKQ